jgi:hypothetical protein
MRYGGHVTLVVVIASAAMLAACGGNTPTAPTASPPPPASQGLVDPALVGTWSGTVDGSFGPGTFTMTLDGVGAMSASGSGNYCSSTGDWGVAGGQFTVRARDCTGTILSFRAPASSTRLSGTWEASSGRGGTFDCTKQ